MTSVLENENRLSDTGPGVGFGSPNRACAGGLAAAFALFFLLLLGTLPALAQSAERIALDAATRDFETSLWERASAEYAEFLVRYPRSSFKAEAQQRLLFAQAESAVSREDFSGAADLFAQFQKQFSEVPRAGLAAVREAELRMKTGNAASAVAVLMNPQGAFIRKAVGGKLNAVAFRGLMARAEAQIALKDGAAAESSLQEAAAFATSPAEEYSRLRQRLRLFESMNRLADALESARQIRALTTKSVDLAGLRAEAAAWEGRLMLKKGDREGASAVFALNTAPGTPPDFFREATLRLVELQMERGDWLRARERLEAFVTALPTDPEINRVRLLLGQTLFRQSISSRGGTNRTEVAGLLASSATQFQLALSNAPSADLTGPLYLGRAWALWEAGTRENAADPIRDAETNFIAAAAAFPKNAMQALARFKAGDCQLMRGDAAAALTQYTQVLDGYPDLPDVQRELGELVAEQTVRAAVLTTNRVVADRAMSRLLMSWPEGQPAKRGGLLFGQFLSKVGDREQARKLLQDFAARFPQSADRADFQLALIASELRAKQWSNAVVRLDALLATTTNAPVLAQAEIERAWAIAMDPSRTNSTEGLSIVASKYPTHPMAPNAHLWVATDYFRSRDFIRAEQTCLRLITNGFWKGQEPWFKALYWAAESARERQSYESALQYLNELLSHKAAPESLLPTAYFALGELRLSQRSQDPSRPLIPFDLALQAFTKAASFEKSPQRAPALGRMADCHLQLATQFRADSPADSGKRAAELGLAAELYQQVLRDPGAELSVRCQAAMGFGTAHEKLAALAVSASGRVSELTAALNVYLDAAHGRLRREGESMLPLWLNDAGREAGRVLEELGRYREAAALYQELAEELPAERAVWTERAAAVVRRSGTTASSAPLP